MAIVWLQLSKVKRSVKHSQLACVHLRKIYTEMMMFRKLITKSTIISPMSGLYDQRGF